MATGWKLDWEMDDKLGCKGVNREAGSGLSTEERREIAGGDGDKMGEVGKGGRWVTTWKNGDGMEERWEMAVRLRCMGGICGSARGPRMEKRRVISEID